VEGFVTNRMTLPWGNTRSHQVQPSMARGRAGTRSGSVVVLASLALVVGGLFSPAAATSSAGKAATAWTKAPQRTVRQAHVPSARTAAATAGPRLTVAPERPVLKTPVAHPSSKVSGPTVGSSPAAVKIDIVGPPDLTPTQTITGLAQAESGGSWPPDPWVAVNSSYVVQVVNTVARISNRAGTELSSVPSWALFGLPGDYVASDARIIWDATHSRWVASAQFFNEAFTDNGLALAVSDGADPQAGWHTYRFGYGAYLPDFPSVASSNDKIVITDNLFNASFTFLGADLFTITWSSILGGASPIVNECTDSDYIHPRAAQVLSSSNDVHVIMESVDDANQWYYRINGTGTCLSNIVDGKEFTFFAPFQTAPDPRQYNGDTISNAFDERPTDAVWQNGHLWWVSTFPWSYSGGPLNDAVVFWNANTVASGVPAEGAPQWIAPGNGIDAFSGGIGMTRGGTLVATWTQSTINDWPYLMTSQIPPGDFLTAPRLLDYSDAQYGQEKWGAYAGVAMDPVGSGSVWVTHELAAADGTWRTKVVRLVADADLPGLPGTPVLATVVPSVLGTVVPSVSGFATVPYRLTWAAATDAGSGVAKYEIQTSYDAGAFGSSATATGASIVRQLLIGHTYQFQIRALDAVGNPGAWRLSPTLRPYLYQSTSSTAYSSGWGSSSSASYSGGSTKYSSTAGKYATFTATTARSIAIVATKAASRGSFKVYVDGAYKATISTYSTTTKFRQLVYQFAWSTPGTHKIKIVVSGTAGHPRVDLDAFVVLR
jgi:hypothetical protein